VETRPARAVDEAVDRNHRNLRIKGIGFRSLTEALDTTTAQGRLVFHMFGALAEFERSLIRERTQAGLAAARRAGRTGGRPPKLTDDGIEAAKATLANPDIGVTQSRTASASPSRCSTGTSPPRELRIPQAVENAGPYPRSGTPQAGSEGVVDRRQWVICGHWHVSAN
jgi:DNA invertase Pin-like site-specific DNA recombinase